MLAPWIIEHFPPHRIYCEPYGGAGSVLLRKPRAYAEVYNDLDDGVVGLFQVLRSDMRDKLISDLRLTPFSRLEFEEAYKPTADPVEAARRLVTRAFMGFGGDGHNVKVKTGFRGTSKRAGTTPAQDWRNFPEALRNIVERLQGVVIENRPALDLIDYYDSPETLFYLDPPYMPETRSQKSRRGKIKYHAYAHEMSADDHATMLKAIQYLKGMVVLSGYHSKLYNKLLADWKRFEKKTVADGARPRVEVLWLNKNAELNAPQIPLEI